MWGPPFLGDFLDQVGRREEAYVQYTATVSRNPDNILNYVRLYLAAAASGHDTAAQGALKRIGELDPSGTSVRDLRWRQAVWSGDWDLAARLAVFDTAAERSAGLAAYRAAGSGSRARKDAAAAAVLALPQGCCVARRIEMLAILGHPGEAHRAPGELSQCAHPGAQSRPCRQLAVGSGAAPALARSGLRELPAPPWLDRLLAS